MDIRNLKLSQSCQVPLLLHFYEKYLEQTGTFVEVGAYDGESFSNTSCLADAGWTGYYIEPIPDFFKKCASRHSKNNVRVFNYGISDRDEFIELNIAGPITTASNETLSVYKELAWSKGMLSTAKLSIQAITLDSFLRSNDIKKGFELLVVDVEGFEENVFNGFDLGHWSPKMMIVELNDYHPDFNNLHKLQMSSKTVRERIIASAYKQVYADAINSIFVRN
jgi:FkbM family methyltransferase